MRNATFPLIYAALIRQVIYPRIYMEGDLINIVHAKGEDKNNIKYIEHQHQYPWQSVHCNINIALFLS